MRTRIAALLALIVLVGAAAWQWHADEADARAHTLTPLDPDAIGHVTVALRGAPLQHFERRNGHWVSPEGHTDQGRAGELAGLAATPVASWQPASDFDAAKIGLAPPLAVLTLDDVRIEFGEMTALGKQRYVRIGNRIAFVPAQALPRAPRTASLPTTATTTATP